jgi:tripartite-type tricarboxylate transporter receptor subunit TctC
MILARRRVHLGSAVSLILLAGLIAGPVAAEDFYQGKQIQLTVGSGTGGGYDAYARLVARHWPDFIPGHPTFVVQNMPGAGSLKAMNYLANNAAKDGTAVAGIQNHIGYEPMLGISGGGKTDAVHFDPLKVNWIGSAAKEVSVVVIWHTSPVKTLEDAQKREVVGGSAGVATSNTIYARLMNATAGTRFNVVHGYKSQTEVALAMERGEVEASPGWFYSSFVSSRPQWLPEGKARIIAQVALEKHPALPDVPIILDYAKTPEDRQQMELALGSLSMGRPYVAPAEVPADRVKLLRETFLKALASPALLAEAKKAKLEISALSGEDIAKLLAKQYKTPKPIVAKVKSILVPEKN